MTLERLDIQHIRNITQESINPSPFINIIIGDNASGKSSLLESIFILGRAHSFRTSKLKNVISHDKDFFIVSGSVVGADRQSLRLGVKFDSKAIEIHVNQQQSHKRSDLAYALPIQLFYSKSYDLLESSARFRREFLDWGVFNTEKSFLLAWRNFRKILLQRNEFLKKKQVKYIKFWDKELIHYALIINQFRCQYLEAFTPFFIESCQFFLPTSHINFHLNSGWDISKTLSECLALNLENDLRFGFTRFGPHRCDFSISVDGYLSKDVVSRGQLKLLITCLKLAQIRMLKSTFSISSTVLMDDFNSDIDFDNRNKLLSYLSSLSCQVFIAGNSLSEFGDLLDINSYGVFHVKHGHVSQTN